MSLGSAFYCIGIGICVELLPLDASFVVHAVIDATAQMPIVIRINCFMVAPVCHKLAEARRVVKGER